MNQNKKIDFLAIGDITTDAFIKLENAEVICESDEKECKLCMNFGDKIPYERVDVVPAVGNSPNASVSASRLGLSSALLTHLGKDEQGKECLNTLEKNEVNTENCLREDEVNTNYHYVLSYRSERTILVRHNKFNYNFKSEVKNLPIPKWLYLSSVGKDTLDYHKNIATWVKENNIKMTFQPGTYQIKLGAEKLKDIYEATESFFCNMEEAQRILKTDTEDIKYLLKEINKFGPKFVFITDGRRGAYGYDSYKNKMYHQPAYPDQKNVIDRTGAGDSFSSTVSVAFSLGKDIEEALSWGPINSCSVIQYVGAQAGLLTQEKLQEYLDKAPEDYQIREI